MKVGAYLWYTLLKTQCPLCALELNECETAKMRRRERAGDAAMAEDV